MVPGTQSASLNFRNAFKGIQQALWGSGAEPSVVEVGAGLLEMITETAQLQAAGAWLQQHHKDRFMIWSMIDLESEAFDLDVMSCTHLVDRPPMLEELFKVCHAIRAWIDCDEGNVAVILSNSDSRTAVACTWVCCAHLLYARAHSSAEKAWRFLWQQRALATQGVQDFLLDEAEAAAKGRVDLPLSHKTYLRYMQELCEHSGLVLEPVLAKRIVLHSIPCVPSCSPPGCNPVFTISSAHSGRLLYSSEWNTGKDAAPSKCVVEDLSAIFPVDTVLMGDIIIKLLHRNLSEDGAEQRGGEKETSELVSFSLNTGLIYMHCLGGMRTWHFEQGIIRLDRSVLGLPLSDHRFDDHFAIDILINPVPRNKPSAQSTRVSPSTPPSAIPSAQEEEEEENEENEERDVCDSCRVGMVVGSDGEVKLNIRSLPLGREGTNTEGKGAGDCGAGGQGRESAVGVGSGVRIGRGQSGGAEGGVAGESPAVGQPKPLLVQPKPQRLPVGGGARGGGEGRRRERGRRAGGGEDATGVARQARADGVVGWREGSRAGVERSWRTHEHTLHARLEAQHTRIELVKVVKVTVEAEVEEVQPKMQGLLQLVKGIPAKHARDKVWALGLRPWALGLGL
jgi:hypothetical protein